MSRDRLNLVTRVVLLAMIGAALVLVIVAARPPARNFSFFAGEIGKPQAILALWDVPVADVTVIHPAIVTFPQDWHIPDQVCMAVRFDKGTAPPSLPYDEYLPQSQWDTNPGAAIVFDDQSIWSRTKDGSHIKVDEQPISDQVVARTAYKVRWFPEQPIILTDNQAAGGLFCYHFELSQIIYHLPFGHQIGFIARNAQVMSWPAYSFRYNADPSPADPPLTVELHREEVNAYLGELANEAAFAVAPLTASQKQQLATEVPTEIRAR